MAKKLSINGKRVTLKERLPARECWPVVALLRRSQQEQAPLSFDEEVTVLAALIESWEFEGDPRDPSAYENLELFDEYVPLSTAVAEEVRDRLTSAKN